MSYIELHACSAFSFLHGASFPEQLAETAAELEMPALALLDRNGVYGAQRFSVAAREQNIRPIIGCELSMEDGGMLPVLVENRTGYRNLCELLTQAHLRSEKGKCAVRWEELPQFAEGLIAFLGTARVSRANASPARTFGVPPKQSFLETGNHNVRPISQESSRLRDAIANTRDACATRSYSRKFLKLVATPKSLPRTN
jgi:DNA polymerase III alpha subunit